MNYFNQDWKWQLRNSISTAEQLAVHLELNSKQINSIAAVASYYKMRITPYYLGLIKQPYEESPIFKQAVPSELELKMFEVLDMDPLSERKYMPVPSLIHKYPDRVVLLVTNSCFMYCRHCTRKNTVVSAKTPPIQYLNEAITYIEKHLDIHDVLISGGDPLFLEDEELEHILGRLRSISHVSTIRIGTRAPVVLPMRITEKLSKILRKYVVWVNTHFNHPLEITDQSAKACACLQDHGIPVGNQTVLLRGINDDIEVMKALFTNLIRIRVRPYYLYQCDYTQGVSHFITPVSIGLNIIRAMRGNISGYAIPSYVVDCPGEGGKIVLEPNNIIEEHKNSLVLNNYQGKQITYPLFHI